MEAYLNYIMTVASDLNTPLKPVHSIVPGEPLDERIAPDLAGFLGQGPVRVGNLAVEQIQHDVYGSAILAATQMFIDHRLARMGDKALFDRLEPLGERAFQVALTPDAGIWEYRGRQRIHTHSAALCWAACDRLARIAMRLEIRERAELWRGRADACARRSSRAHGARRRARSPGALDDDDLDASVLLLAELGLVKANDPRFLRTCEAVSRDLERDGLTMRYVGKDDFGLPETAFLVCSFWYHRRARLDRRARQGAGEVHRTARKAQHLRFALRRLAPEDRPTVGKYSANVFHGRYYQFGDAALGQMGGCMAPRLILVSNRVNVPDGGPRQAGGLTVAVNAALKQREGVWFGWSGNVSDDDELPPPTVIERRRRTYITIDLSKTDFQEYYNGFANRVLWPALHYRVDLAEFTSVDLSGYQRVNATFRRRAIEIHRARGRHLGSRLSSPAHRAGIAEAGS